jgi:hypothetical protein
MRIRVWYGLAALLAGLGAVPLAAQETMTAKPVCAAPVVPEGALAAWTAQADMQAQGDPAKLGGARIQPGQAVRVALLPTPDVHFPMRPEKPGGSVSHGGLIGVDVEKAGTYRVALGSGAWIDLIGNGNPVISTAHGHGPDCTGIRKMVDFALTPGHYTLQISANAEPQISLLVVSLP